MTLSPYPFTLTDMSNRVTDKSAGARGPKAAKRAEALRGNLLKRKQQTRARHASDKEKK